VLERDASITVIAADERFDRASQRGTRGRFG
jgi:hypothetical protein